MKTTSLALTIVTALALGLAACTKAPKQKTADIPDPVASPMARIMTPGAPGMRPTTPRRSSPKAAAVLLVPRTSIGPVKLGMTRVALKKIGLKVRLHPSGQMGNNVLLVGPYYVVLTGGKVSSIEFNLTKSAAGVKIGKTVLSPGSRHATVAKAMPSCGKLEHLTGGSMYRCDGGRLLVKMGGPVSPAPIQVQIFATPLKTK